MILNDSYNGDLIWGTKARHFKHFFKNQISRIFAFIVEKYLPIDNYKVANYPLAREKKVRFDKTPKHVFE
jgi:hypothetical protein